MFIRFRLRGRFFRELYLKSNIVIVLGVLVVLGCSDTEKEDARTDPPPSVAEQNSDDWSEMAGCTSELGLSQINLVTRMIENKLLTNAPRYIEQQDRKYIDSVAWRMLTHSRKVTLMDSIAFSVRCVEPQVLTLKLLDMYSGKELASWGTGYGIRIKN